MIRLYAIIGAGIGALMILCAIYYVGYSDATEKALTRKLEYTIKLEQELKEANEQVQKQQLAAQRIQDDADKQLDIERKKQQDIVDSLNRMLTGMRNRMQLNTGATDNHETVSSDARIKRTVEAQGDGGRQAALDKCLRTAAILATERDEIAIRLNTLIDVYNQTKEEVNHGSESKRLHD